MTTDRPRCPACEERQPVSTDGVFVSHSRYRVGGYFVACEGSRQDPGDKHFAARVPALLRATDSAEALAGRLRVIAEHEEKIARLRDGLGEIEERAQRHAAMLAAWDAENPTKETR